MVAGVIYGAIFTPEESRDWIASWPEDAMRDPILNSISREVVAEGAVCNYRATVLVVHAAAGTAGAGKPGANNQVCSKNTACDRGATVLVVHRAAAADGGDVPAEGAVGHRRAVTGVEHRAAGAG